MCQTVHGELGSLAWGTAATGGTLRVPRPDIQCHHHPPHNQNKPHNPRPSSSCKGVANTCRQLTLLIACRQGPTLKSLLLVALTLVVVVPGAWCYPVMSRRDEVWERWVPRQRRELINDETQWYLMKYGYLPMSDMETGNLRTEYQLREAIKTMQRFGHIPVTGRIDEDTKALMKRPRCSLPDVMPGNYNLQAHSRVKRFVKQGSRWDRYNLTWGIRTYPTQIRERTGRPGHLTRWEIQREIRLATEVWGRASRLVFLEQENNPERADIIVDFKTGYHGDGYPFDGQGRTLAHAFYPGHGIGGDMHFDDEEMWVQHKDSTDTWDHVSLFITAAHELGHALGLYHSDVEGALMSPYLIKFPSTFDLPEDDVRGIQELYGIDENWKGNVPPTPPPKPTQPPTKSPTKKPVLPPKNTGKPDTCDTDFDAISVIRREVYIFKGKYFWRLNSAGVLRPNYPAEINRFWTMLPKNITHIDAVYERPHDSNIVFFVGDHYYVCQGNHLLLESKPLTELGLPKDLKKIDAAFVWGHNGRTYFFAESMYWRFDETVQNVELDYPRDMVMWSGVPYSIDSAFKFNGTTYFFKGKIFWEFDDLRMKVKPKSPALSAPFWFGCPNTKNQFLLGAPVSESDSASSVATNIVALSTAPLTVLTLRITTLLLSSLSL
ncbi:matrix metalloproteinase-2-like isoform X1 [Macrobrachium nipponense]|uniref:matrix metalloproteinase-2-like isoform X1 n=1 Tax=Macrobrachium nipponense TaxID=159736 RepID=UPI0030C8CBF9